MGRAATALVYDELRTPAKALLMQGYTFTPHGHGLRLIDPGGKWTGLIFPGKGRGHQDVKSLMAELAKRGLYPPQQHDDAPAIGSVVRLPVEPRTSHQYRLEQVRASVMRVLRELGGVNDREARRLFVQDAIETAQRHGLRLPSTKVTGATAQEAVYASARQSLHKLLQGEGQAGWMLDIWQLEVTMLAHPQPHVALNAPAALAAANDATVPVPAWAADGPEPLASPGPAVVVAQEQDDDGPLRTVVRSRSGTTSTPLPLVVPERDEQPTKLERAVVLLRRELAGGPRLGRDVYAVLQAEGIGSRTTERARKELGVTARPTGQHGVYTWELPGADGVTRSSVPPAQPEQVAPPTPEVVIELAAADHVALVRAGYLAALQEQALQGDQQAADRLERLLGL